MSEYTRQQVIEMVARGESLAGADLSLIDLSRVNFLPKKLGGHCERAADFTQARLGGANFSHANLRGGVFKEANLSWANLNYANLGDADLKQADLSWSRLNRSKINKADLSQADICWADLSEANLLKSQITGADLLGVDFSGADLSYTSLRDSNLTSVDFEEAVLRKTDISGANICYITTTDWKIEDIKCSHVYQAPTWQSWKNPKEREKFRVDFKPGEFERVYHDLPKIKLVFQKGFVIKDHNLLAVIIEGINERLSSPLDICRLEKSINTVVYLSADNFKSLTQAAPLLHEAYKDIFIRYNAADSRLSDEKEQPAYLQSIKAVIQKRFRERIPITIPEIFIGNAHFLTTSQIAAGKYDQETFFFSSPEEAREVAQKVFEQLNSSLTLEDTFSQIDQIISAQLEESPEKRKWLETASRELLFSRHFPSLPALLLSFIQTEVGGPFYDIIKSILS